MTHGSKLKLLGLSTALAGVLVGCDGSYDASGRFVPASPGNEGARSALAAGAPEAAAAAAAVAAPQASPGVAAPGSTGGAAPAAYGDAQAAAPSGAQPSFDAFSRTPPPPVLQADGTPSKPVIARVSPEVGAPQGGEEILITGSGFANVQVLFGTMPARITSQSSNAVTVIAPTGPGGRPVSVVVTNRDGTYAVAGHAYSYQPDRG